MLVVIGVCLVAAPRLNHVLSMMLMMLCFMRVPRLWLGRLLLVLNILVLPRLRIMVPICMLVVLGTAAWQVLNRVVGPGSFPKGTAHIRPRVRAVEAVGRKTRPHAMRSPHI